MQKIVKTDGLTREEWLEMRRTGIGGSDASVILGVNPYRSVRELWLDKTGQELNGTAEEKECAYWGHRLEDIVRTEFAERSGLKVQVVPYLLRHDQYPFMQANLDGMVNDPVYGNCIFEAKTVSAYKAEEWHNGIPKEYYAQIQHYLAVTDWQGAYIAALIGGNYFIWKFIERDEEYINSLIIEEEIFWSYVIERKKPPIDGSEATKNYLEKQYPQATKKGPIDLSDDNTIMLLRAYLEINEQMQRLKKEHTLLSSHLKECLGEYEQAIVGESMISWSTVTSSRFDVEEFKRNEPEMYEDYCKQTHCRRFTVRKR